MAGRRRPLWRGTLLAALLAAVVLCGMSAAGQYVGVGAGRTVKVRCLERLAPYVFTGEDGKLTGVYIELLESIARRAQLRFFVETGAADGDEEIPDLVVGSAFPVETKDRLYGALSVRNFDPDDPRMARSVTRMLDSVVEDQQEALCFAFPFLWESSSLFVPQGSADRLENLRGKRICVVMGSPEESFLRKLGYEKEIFPTANVTEGMRTLSLRICDAFVCETFRAPMSWARSAGTATRSVSALCRCSRTTALSSCCAATWSWPSRSATRCARSARADATRRSSTAGSTTTKNTTCRRAF